MNPFSAFLQPTNNRPLEVPDMFGGMANRSMQRKELAERTREADMHNATQQGYLKLQQDQQAHKFAEQDRNEVEGLIKEYQDAVARGEPQGIQDAIQKMKRFGLDVTQQAQEQQAKQENKVPDNTTSRSPFTGLPFQTHDPLKAAPQARVSDGLSNSGVRADSPDDDRLLNQQEFESKLIGESEGRPEQMEQGGQTTPEGKAYVQNTTPQGPEGDPGDAGRNGNVMDLDAPEAQSAQGGQTQTYQLPGMLPVVVSRNGKELYRSGNQGRWSPLVQSVFGAMAQDKDPNVAKAAQHAQAIAEKLVQVEGISPAQAIEIAKGMFEKELDRGAAFSRTQEMAKLVRAKLAAASAGNAGKTEDTLNDDLDKVRSQWVNSDNYKKLQDADFRLESASAGLMSPDGLAQNQAIADIKILQSGLSMNAGEQARFNNAAGALQGLMNDAKKLFGGGELSAEYKQQAQRLVDELRAVIAARKQRGAQEAYDYWMGSRKGRAAPNVIQEKGDTLKKSLGGGDAPAAKSEKDFY